ncbi:MAG: transporter substrate-binding domain-containing protein [Gammaproteobacteria bacterium]|nr:transporter substrate-binding domain-containing protein [Gammaproteobacteria bacterium]
MTRLFKHPLRLLALLVISVAGTAVQTAYADTNTSALSRIKDKGELVLGTSGNMPSMTFKRDDGKVVGFDIDLARFMASGMDVKLNIKTMPFDKLLPALEKGDVDMVISNVTINPERNMSVAFVGPYMTSGKCIITKREGLARAEEATDLNTSKTRLAALKGSTSAEFVKVLLPEAKLKLVDNFDAALAMVNDDKVGGLMTDYPICLSTLKDNPDAGYVTVFSLLSYEPIGVALPGDDALFINWTENFLKRAEGVGLLEELSLRWFGKLTLVAEEE